MRHAFQHLNATTKPRCAVIVIGVLILVAIGIAYQPVLQNDFVLLDDPAYVLQNSQVQGGLTIAGFKWAFISLEACNWHPLTWISHMVDVQFFGDRAGLHHLTSLVFHALNALLLLLLLRELTGAVWRSAIVAGLFALHPLHVESVAWAAERKDVLSTCFGLLSLLAYARYARRAGASPHRPGKFPAYWLAVVFLALGLMSKPMLVTWPFLMLVLDCWPMNRWRSRSRHELVGLIREKLPMFCLSLASCIVTYAAQQKGGATLAMEAVSFGSRIGNALISYGNYLKLALWPTDLAVFYPFSSEPAFVSVAVSVFVLATVSFLAMKRRQPQPYLLAGWLWYLGTLIPVIGIVQVGMQACADRYTYFPLTGIFIAGVWGVHEALAGWRHKAVAGGALALGALATLAVLTHQQVKHWRDTETLFTHTLSVTKDNPMAEISMGCARMLTKEYAEARQHFLAALRLWPKNPDAQINLGLAYAAENRLGEAADCYRQVIQFKPRFLRAYLLSAEVSRKLGRFDDALATYRQALAISPNDVWLLRDVASLLAACPKAEIRNGAEAIRLAEQACAQTGYQDPFALSTLGMAQAEAGHFSEAIKFTERSRELAEAGGLKNLAAKQAALLRLYRDGRPYREPAE